MTGFEAVEVKELFAIYSVLEMKLIEGAESNGGKSFDK